MATACYSTVYSHPVLGDLTLACDGEALVGLWLAGQKYFGASLDAPLQREDDLPVFDVARAWLDRYFAGDPLPVSDVPLNPHGTEFRRRVWRVLADIPYGEVVTYGDIARELSCEHEGGRTSARAVGGAVGRNPLSIILPCHRVVGQGGSLTGYAGGVERKRWLLEHEGVDVSRLSIPSRGTAL